MTPNSNVTVVPLTNTDDPMTGPDGNAVTGIMTFLLTDEYGKAAIVLDTVSSETICPIPIAATIDVNGEIAVNLWPNDRGLTKSCYKVSADNPNIKPFCIVVTGSGSTLYDSAAAYIMNGAVANNGTLLIDGGEIDGVTDNILDGGTFS